MTYTTKQIENAKMAYNSFLQFTSVEAQEPEIIGQVEAENRAEYHNNIVSEIRTGNKELEKKWKVFFCNEEVKKDQKANQSKAKKSANKEASADILAPIKKMKKIGEFGKWLNTSGNKYRKQHFNKFYTYESVNEFLSTL